MNDTRRNTKRDGDYPSTLVEVGYVGEQGRQFGE